MKKKFTLEMIFDIDENIITVANEQARVRLEAMIIKECFQRDNKFASLIESSSTMEDVD